MERVYAVILAGGSGTRFWPASRRDRPKQLQPLVPGSNRSLIALTVDRLGSVCTSERVLVATAERLLDATRAELDLPAEAFLGEPVARNTAPAIAWATLEVARRDPEAVVMVLPSDHFIEREDEFAATLRTAIASASAGVMTAIGITPTRPETGFGYIEVGDEVRTGVHRAVRFVEKPDAALAEEYVASGRYLWNAGMFFFRASAMLEAIARYVPELDRGLQGLRATPGDRAAIERFFGEAPSISIDYAVMEKMDTLHVVPGDFGWSDLGSWQAAWELAHRDEHGNAMDEAGLVIDGRNNLVRNYAEQTKLVALVGVDDLCVVQTEDALLVIPRARAQDAKAVVAALAELGKDELA